MLFYFADYYENGTAVASVSWTCAGSASPFRECRAEVPNHLAARGGNQFVTMVREDDAGSVGVGVVRQHCRPPGRVSELAARYRKGRSW